MSVKKINKKIKAETSSKERTSEKKDSTKKTEFELLNILNPLIRSESIWKSHALYLMAEFFYFKNEKIVATIPQDSILRAYVDNEDKFNLTRNQLLIDSKS